MKRFEYSQPATLDEAAALLRRSGQGARLLAGGTDLLVEIKEQIRHPGHVIDVKRIPGLSHLRFDPADGLRCGALVTVREIETSPVVQDKYRALHAAARELGSIQVRNRATLVGNVCRASPSADTLPPLIADGASLSMHGPAGTREVKMETFFTGPGRTLLEGDEIVTEIRIPPPAPLTGKAYIKHGRRRAMELATVGVAVSLTRQDDVVQEVRIVLGAVAPTPIRARHAEALLRGQRFGERLVEAAAMAAMNESRPISDVRASADYRRQMVAVLTRRALGQAWEATR